MSDVLCCNRYCQFQYNNTMCKAGISSYLSADKDGQMICKNFRHIHKKYGCNLSSCLYLKNGLCSRNYYCQYLREQ